jgi:cytoskeletal protein RodZ
MSRVAKLIGLSLVAFLLTAHRLPAPIVEEEKSTPAAEQSEAPKRKRSTRSTTTEKSSAQTETRTQAAPAPVVQGPARFAGTWNGKINQGLLGHVPTSVTIDSNATSVELNRNLGGGNRAATTNGNSISWHSGVAGEITWTLIPNGDGQTAQVTMKGMLLNDTVTFRRGQTSLPSPSPAHR